MENISFVIWVMFFPLVCSIDSYLSTKRRVIAKEEMPSKSVLGKTALIQIIIWIAIAIYLKK